MSRLVDSVGAVHLGRRRRVIAIALGSSLTACASAAPPSHAVALPPSREARVDAVAKATAPTDTPAGRETWSVAYERRCIGSETAPAVSPDGKKLAFCEGLFDAKSGVFEKRLPIGVRIFTSSSLALRDDFQGHVALWDVAADANGASFDSEHSDGVAVSPDGSKVLVLATRDASVQSLGEDSFLSLRDATSLATVSRTTFKGTRRATLGFLADGTPLLFTGQPCKAGQTSPGSWQTRCAEPALYTMRGNHLARGPAVFDGAKAVAFAERGERAVVVDRSGRVRVVDPKTGSSLVEIPTEPIAGDEELSIAISPDGRQVALSRGTGISIFAARSAAAELTHQEPAWPDGLTPESFAFSPDGRALYLASSTFMEALTVEPVARHVAPPKLTIEPPKGFRPAPPEPYGQRSPASTLVREGTWTGKNASFSFFTEDAEELDPRLDDETWGRHIVARFASTENVGDDGARAFHLRVWKTSKGREAALETHFTTGCDPVDIYYRFSERGSILYRGELSVSMFHRPKRKTIGRWLDAFFASSVGEQPLGEQGQLDPRLAALPTPPKGPC